LGTWTPASLTENHAQDVGGQNRGRHIHGRHWARVAAESGINATRLRRRVDEICVLIQAEVDAAVDEVVAMPGGHHGMLAEFSREIRARAQTVCDHNAA
jgi:serine/threonine-protein kinase HipA